MWQSPSLFSFFLVFVAERQALLSMSFFLLSSWLNGKLCCASSVCSLQILFDLDGLDKSIQSSNFFAVFAFQMGAIVVL
jgi:hypothetical protein